MALEDKGSELKVQGLRFEAKEKNPFNFAPYTLYPVP
jgi:hypothetical protein